MLTRRAPVLLAIAALALVVWRAGLLGGNTSTSTSYVGTTSQGLPISFTATSSSADNITFTWQAACSDGQTHTNSIDVGNVPISAGAFSTSGTLNTGGQVSVSGQVSGSTASGQLSRSGPTAFGTDCTDSGVTWTAHS